MSEPILSIKNLNVTRNGKELFKNFNLDLYEGEIVGIFAPSGSGKSTLLDLILGNFVSDSPVNIEKKKNIYFSVCFQETRLIESETVLKNVMLSMEKRIGKKNASKLAEEIINKIGLSYRIKNMVTELSGGEKQRVSLARALCYKSDIMLLDEPFQSQDEITKKKLMDITKKIVENEKRALILVSHQIEEIKFFTDNVITEKDFVLNN